MTTPAVIAIRHYTMCEVTKSGFEHTDDYVHPEQVHENSYGTGGASSGRHIDQRFSLLTRLAWSTAIGRPCRSQST